MIFEAATSPPRPEILGCCQGLRDLGIFVEATRQHTENAAGCWGYYTDLHLTYSFVIFYLSQTQMSYQIPINCYSRDTYVCSLMSFHGKLWIIRVRDIFLVLNVCFPLSGCLQKESSASNQEHLIPSCAGSGFNVACNSSKSWFGILVYPFSDEKSLRISWHDTLILENTLEWPLSQ